MDTTIKNTIWTPSTINEWLDERIEFTKLYPERIDFIILNQNFTYCLKLYNERNNSENLRLFKSLGLKLLFDILYEWDKVENRCVTIHDTPIADFNITEGNIVSVDITFPTNEKNDFLPQEFWDNQKKWRDALENIYNQIMEL